MVRRNLCNAAVSVLCEDACRLACIFERLQLRPAAINLPVEFRKDEATFQNGLSRLRTQAQFAAAINCPRLVTYILPSSDTPKDELRDLYKRRFTECARALAESPP